MVVGSRGTAGSGWYRMLGKWLYRGMLRCVMPLPIRDVHSGMCVYRTTLARHYAALCPDSMAFSEVMKLTFLRHGQRSSEVPIMALPRVAGHSSVDTRQAFRTFLALLSVMMRE